jgi:hypothetical protein
MQGWPTFKNKLQKRDVPEYFVEQFYGSFVGKLFPEREVLHNPCKM